MILRALLTTSAAFSFVLARAEAQCGTWEGSTDPTLEGPAYAMAILESSYGPLLYTGLHYREWPIGMAAPHVAVWSGVRWTTHSYMNGQVRAVAVFDSGAGPKLYAAGDFTTTEGGSSLHIARATVTSWASVGSGIDGRVDALFVFDDGAGLALYAGGLFATAGGVPAQNLARWDGTSWSAVGGGLDGEVHAIGSYDASLGATLVVGGDFTHAGGAPAAHVAAWNGSSWSALGAGVDGTVRALRSYRSGAVELLAAGGDFTHAGGADAVRVARWDGTTWAGLGAGFDGTVRALAKHDFGAGNELCAGGHFEASGGTTCGPVARWNGVEWIAAGTQLSGTVNTLISYASSFETSPRLVAGGDLGILPSDAGSLNVAAYDGTAWRSFGEGVSDLVYRVLAHRNSAGPAVYAVGDFHTAGGVRVDGIGRWDGSHWSALGSGLQGGGGFALAEHDDGSGLDLYAGGDFTHASGVPAAAVARWDGTNWHAVGTGLGGHVLSLASVAESGGPRLYALGATDLLAGGGEERIVRWDGSSWSPIANLPYVWADLASFDDGTGAALYACGQGVQRWNGSEWTNVGTISGWFNHLRALDDGGGSKLYVGGSGGLWRWSGSSWISLYSSPVEGFGMFDEGTGAGPQLFTSAYIRILKLVDGSWAYSTFIEGGSTIPALDMASFDAEDGRGTRLVIGGTLDGLIWETEPSYGPMDGIATLYGCGQTGRLFCFGDGSSTPCPCGNASAVGDEAGCLNSIGTAGTVRARGLASLAHDTLTLDGASMTNSSALFVQGASLANGGAGVVFGDGLKCAGAPFWRLGTRANAGGASSIPEPGGLPISVRGHVASPGVRYYQIRYRNPAPFCTPDTFNYTNGVEIVWSL